MKGFLELQRERENNILYLWTILEFLVAIPSAVSGRGLDSDAPLSLSLSLSKSMESIFGTNIVFISNLMDSTHVVKDLLDENGFLIVGFEIPYNTYCMGIA